MKKRAFCPICKERLVKRQMNGEYGFDSQKKRLVKINGEGKRFRHYCKKDEQVVFNPIWR